MIFFRFAKLFQFYVVAPHQQKCEIFEKVEHWTLVMVLLFSVSDPVSEKLTIF